MASNLPTRKLVSVGKQLLRHVITSRPSASLLLRRTVHVSVYDKNVDDHVRPALVPDEVIEVQSEKYWSPHPKTGVFGPDTDHQATATGERELSASEESVLEQKSFFRPQEDLDKPAHP
ncbi:hypothetical protein Leryth_004016 [Lithospermum erythrorhizon]|nr:hypothetical protein Leryth_004016 [Lithospermum erythrorhizon]